MSKIALSALITFNQFFFFFIFQNKHRVITINRNNDTIKNKNQADHSDLHHQMLVGMLFITELILSCLSGF